VELFATLAAITSREYLERLLASARERDAVGAEVAAGTP
jgi:hypothetical protein